VAEMRKWQEEQADESRPGWARGYFERGIAIVRPVRGRVVVCAVFAVTILAVDLKYTTEGSSWMYSVVNAVMIAIGIGLAVLSTAMMLSNETRK
jgi:hypothetical protein